MRSLLAVAVGDEAHDQAKSVRTGGVWDVFRSVSLTGVPDNDHWIGLADARASGVAEIGDHKVSMVTDHLPRQHAIAMVVGSDSQEQIADDVERNLVAIWYEIPHDAQIQFENWFTLEHAPLILQEPALLRTRRLRIASLGGFERAWSHLVIHELASLSALSSRAFEIAKEAPGRKQLQDVEWFNDRMTHFYARDLGQSDI